LRLAALGAKTAKEKEKEEKEKNLIIGFNEAGPARLIPYGVCARAGLPPLSC
jgi:hypothetical protein